MKAKYILGCDIGTTSTKLIVLNRQGEVCLSIKENYETNFPQPGWAEQDAGQYWHAFVSCARKAINRLGISADEVEAIGFSGMAPNCILVDRQLNPLKAAIIWMDNRATDESTWLTEQVGEEKAWQISANAIHPYYGLPKLIWEHNHNPQIYDQTYKVLGAKDFVIACLTGEVVTDYSTATLFAPGFDIRSKRWDRDILLSANINHDKLPLVVPCDKVIGRISKEAARDCGLASGIPVVAGTVDTGADAEACGVIEPGSSFLTTGTAFCLGTILDQPKFVRGLMAFPHAIQSSTHYITTGVVTSGGALMNWFGSILSEKVEEGGNDPNLFNQLDQEAAQIAAGSEGLVILPYFMGERAPIWDPFAKGVFFGLSLKHSRGHIARALMESVAYGLRAIIELGRQSGVKYSDKLFLIGGGAQSQIWNQIIASVTGLQTVQVMNPLGSAVGAAMIAGLSTGFLTSTGMVTRHLQLGPPFIPKMEDARVYDKCYLTYKELYQDLRPLFVNGQAIIS